MVAVLEENINTFTLYAHFAGMKDNALERLKQLRTALFQNAGPFDNPEDYLENAVREDTPYFALIENRRKRIDELNQQIRGASPNSTEVIEANREIVKLDTEVTEMDGILSKYLNDHEEAVSNFLLSSDELATLISGNNTYQSPTHKRSEYLYWLDQRTCKHLINNPVPVAVDDNGRCFFVTDEAIDMIDEQTDAVRVSANGVTLKGITINDDRLYDLAAHRDAFQLIPPPKIAEATIDGKLTNIRLADQLAGTILSDVVIKGCQVSCERGPLQGIFASDGLLSNITIDGNEIKTAGEHAISLAGLLDRSHITNNTLHQVNPDSEPAIKLFPLRIGGNMAEEGVVVVLSFAAGNRYAYEPPVFDNNVLIKSNGERVEAPFQDMRSRIPDVFLEFAVGLHNFDYDAYFFNYTNLSIGEFKGSYAIEYDRMRDWLDTRIDEYNVRIQGNFTEPAELPEGIDEFDDDLPPEAMGEEVAAAAEDPHKEIREFILPSLIKSRDKLNLEEADLNAPFWNTRLGNLEESPIRNFVMKAVAIQHGDIAPFEDLPEPGQNERRARNLRFLIGE